MYATARSEARSKATIDGIIKEHPSIKKGLLIPLMVDFESPESVQDAVEELKRRESKLDVMSKSLFCFTHSYRLPTKADTAFC